MKAIIIAISLLSAHFCYKKFFKYVFKCKLKELIQMLNSENDRIEEILYMDDTSLLCSNYLEKKKAENITVITYLKNWLKGYE